MLDLGCEIFDRAFVRNGFVGLAFSGFGESQIFPSLIHIMLTTMVNGKIRYIIADKPEISEKQFATITPLAQDDVMRSFLKYSLQGTTQGRYLTGGVPPVRFSM